MHLLQVIVYPDVAILAAWNMKVVYFRAQLMLQVSSVDCSSLVAIGDTQCT